MTVARLFRLLALFCFTLAGCAQATPGITLARVPDGGVQPQVIDKNGLLHLVFLKGDPKASDVFYTRSNDSGQTWSAPLRVNSQAGSAIAMGTIRGAQIAVGRNGRVFVAWNGSNAARPRNDWTPESAKQFGASPYLFARLKDDGKSFEPQRNLMTKTFNLDGGGSLAADDEGRVYAVWHANDQAGQDEGGRHVWLARSTDDGATFTAETPVWKQPTGVCGCCQLRLMAENGGKVRLLYRAATDVVNRDTFILLSTDAGATFRGAKIHPWKIGACPMSSYAFAGSGPQIWATWESDKKVYMALLDGISTPNIIEAPGRGNNRKHPALATNSDKQTLLAWDEDTGWAKGGKIRWQLFDAQGITVTGAAGERDGMPAWSYTAAFARPDGGFTILY